MAKKYIEYEKAREQLFNKNFAVNNFIDLSFAKTNEMFIYKNLPDSIPAKRFEYLLQLHGKLFFTEVDGKLYALDGTLGGEKNAYGELTKITVTNTFLKLSKEYDIERDGVLIRNDTRMVGLLPILSKYGVMLTDCEISLNVMSILLRAGYLISAQDDRTKESAEDFFKRLSNGDYGVVAESQFFDGVKSQPLANSNNQMIMQMIQLTQYIKASALNEIGLNANYNMKKERITNSEYALSIDALLPFSENMLNCRKEAIEKINAMYNQKIEVEMNSVWEVNKNEMEKENDLSEQPAEENNNTHVSNEENNSEGENDNE